jgi:hypothetical protein
LITLIVLVNMPDEELLTKLLALKLERARA